MNSIDFLRILNAVDPVKTGAFMGRMAAYDHAICSAITDEQKQFVVANIGGILGFLQSPSGQKSIAEFVAAWQGQGK